MKKVAMRHPVSGGAAVVAASAVKHLEAVGWVRDVPETSVTPERAEEVVSSKQQEPDLEDQFDNDEPEA